MNANTKTARPEIITVRPPYHYIMCESLLGQQGWIDRLRKRGYNYFVPYHDTRSRYALIASVAFWVNPGSIYICPP